MHNEVASDRGEGKALGPTGIWPFLLPWCESGTWRCGCPLGCQGGGIVDLVCLDHEEMLPGYALAGPCSAGCRLEAMALRLAAITGQDASAFLPPIVVDQAMIDRLVELIHGDAAVHDAWFGIGSFRSRGSRRAALGHRLREAGADEGLIVLAARMLVTEPPSGAEARS